MGFIPASVMHKKRSEVIRITTGVRGVDDLLGGGFETGCIYEICGPARSGKTQLCHVLAVTTQVINMNLKQINMMPCFNFPTR